MYGANKPNIFAWPYTVRISGIYLTIYGANKPLRKRRSMAARAVRSTGSLQAAAAAALAGPSAKAPSRVRPPIATAAQTLGRRGGGSADRSAADRSLLPLFEDDQGPYYAESESLQTFRDAINDGISGELALRLNAIDDQGKVILGKIAGIEDFLKVHFAGTVATPLQQLSAEEKSKKRRRKPKVERTEADIPVALSAFEERIIAYAAVSSASVFRPCGFSNLFVFRR